MIAELLQRITPTCEIETKQVNEEVGFSIQLAKAADWNYFILFTDGLSAKEQAVPEKYAAFKHLELYFCLPDYWDFETEKWPLYWLNKLAELPQKNETWYGPGDTIPAGDPPIGLSLRFPANHFMLAEPLKLKTLLTNTVFEEKQIQFMGIIPILQDELDYKIRNSATVLMARLVKDGYTEQVDLFRQPVCRKRFLNFL